MHQIFFKSPSWAKHLYSFNRFESTTRNMLYRAMYSNENDYEMRFGAVDDNSCRLCPKHDISGVNGCGMEIGQVCFYGERVAFDELPKPVQNLFKEVVFFNPLDSI